MALLELPQMLFIKTAWENDLKRFHVKTGKLNRNCSVLAMTLFFDITHVPRCIHFIIHVEANHLDIHHVIYSEV